MLGFCLCWLGEVTFAVVTATEPFVYLDDDDGNDECKERGADDIGRFKRDDMQEISERAE